MQKIAEKSIPYKYCAEVIRHVFLGDSSRFCRSSVMGFRHSITLPNRFRRSFVTHRRLSVVQCGTREGRLWISSCWIVIRSLFLSQIVMDDLCPAKTPQVIRQAP